MMSYVSHSLICHENILKLYRSASFIKKITSLHPSHITPFNHPSIIFGKILAPFKRGISISPIGYPLLRTYPHPKEPGFPIPTRADRRSSKKHRLRGNLLERLGELSRREKYGEADYETEQLGTRFSLKKNVRRVLEKATATKIGFG